MIAATLAAGALTLLAAGARAGFPRVSAALSWIAVGATLLSLVLPLGFAESIDWGLALGPVGLMGAVMVAGAAQGCPPSRTAWRGCVAYFAAAALGSLIAPGAVGWGAWVALAGWGSLLVAGSRVTRIRVAG